MTIRFLISAAIVFLPQLYACQAALGQDVVELDRGAVGAYLQLKQLQTTGSVLHVVAHPDDEDGAFLTYCARGLGVRTMLFAITRGEGGANLISSQFFDELGALRTLEHLKAAGYYGNELFYSRGADYGYSKSLEEAMGQWDNGLPMLSDLVEVIRREKPTAIVSRFRGDPRDGHGHHQMAGVISRLAFDAAADPQQFPGQLERGLQTWQVKKLYVTAGSPWQSPKEGEWTIAIPTGEFDPLLGKSYAQIARFGLGFQRSQGISGHESDPGPKTSYYRLEKHFGVEQPAISETSLFDGLDTSLASLGNATSPDRIESTESAINEIEREIAEVAAGWNPRSRETTAQRLLKLLSKVRTVIAMEGEPAGQKLPVSLSQALRRKERQLEQAIVSLLGLQLDCWANGDNDEPISHATPDDDLHVRWQVANRSSSLPLILKKTQVITPAGSINVPIDAKRVQPGDVHENHVVVSVPKASPTRPHWQRESIQQPMYKVDLDGQQRPVPEPPFHVSVEMSIDDVPVSMLGIVHVRFRHPEFGQVRYPLTVVPTMSVRFPISNGVVSIGASHYETAVIVRSSAKGKATAQVQLELPDAWTSSPAVHTMHFEREDEEATFTFQVLVPENATAQEYPIHAIVSHNGQQYREGFETITARDLDRLNIYHDATHRVRVADLTMVGEPRVGYIPGSGDKVAESLGPLGIEPQILSATDLASGDLSAYDVILVGVRAYAVREDIRKYNSRLLDFAQRGGLLIVQYQTPEFDQNFGPFPYKMGRRPEEVSEEDSHVTMLVPEHPLFNSPNRIESSDFDGWFEQRGSKFWQEWDDRYVAVLECHDTGQAPQKGGMLVTRYGEGLYVYSAYAWYRQLPNGVPGAYRLFANLLSLQETMRN